MSRLVSRGTEPTQKNTSFKQVAILVWAQESPLIENTLSTAHWDIIPQTDRKNMKNKQFAWFYQSYKFPVEHVYKIISRERLIRRSNTSKRKGLDAQEQSRKGSQKWEKFHKEQDQVKGTVLKIPKKYIFVLKSISRWGLSCFLWTLVRHKGPFVPCETYRKGKYENVPRETSHAINYPTYHKER